MSNPEPIPTNTSSKSRRLIAIAAVTVLAVILAVIIYTGIAGRVAAESKLANTTEQAAVESVSVVHPTAGAPIQEIVLPGNTQAYTETPIYSRTNGYLKKWYFDIGARVKKGQLLADIQTPEVDQQLLQARADLETAKANFHLAETTAARWQALLKTNSVSKQETDQTVSNMVATKAAADASAANVHRLEELQSFEKVYAPFDGVITARNTDIGALIAAGENAPAQYLFRLAALNPLRVFVAVPEVYDRAAKSGATSTLTLEEYPGRSFTGRIVRNSSSIDLASRTLTVEVDVDNREGLLLPGAYVSVHLNLPRQSVALIIPSNTLLFRAEGLQVGVVQNNRAVLVPVKIGRDYGNTVEIVSGLHPSDSVILNPSDALITGAPVRAGGSGQ